MMFLILVDPNLCVYLRAEWYDEFFKVTALEVQIMFISSLHKYI